MKQFVPSCRLLAKVCDKVASASGESASGQQTMSTVSLTQEAEIPVSEIVALMRSPLHDITDFLGRGSCRHWPRRREPDQS